MGGITIILDTSSSTLPDSTPFSDQVWKKSFTTEMVWKILQIRHGLLVSRHGSVQTAIARNAARSPAIVRLGDHALWSRPRRGGWANNVKTSHSLKVDLATWSCWGERRQARGGERRTRVMNGMLCCACRIRPRLWWEEKWRKESLREARHCTSPECMRILVWKKEEKGRRTGKGFGNRRWGGRSGTRQW